VHSGHKPRHRPRWNRQDAGPGPKGGFSETISAGDQEHPVRLPQYCPGQLHKTAPFGKGVGIGPGAVEVYHFFELCSKVLGEQVQYENESDDYYQLVIEETLSRSGSSGVKYDAVLIDEGQDFTEKMIEVVRGLTNADTPNLTIAADEHQGTFNEGITTNLKFLYPEMKVDRLGKMHRNTLQIHSLISRFMGWKQAFSASCDASGPAPQVLKFGSCAEITGFVSETIRNFHDSEEYPLSEMAILYAGGFTEGKEVSLPDIFRTELESRGIMTNWIAEDYRSKRSYDITTDMISVSTIDSAKGLDYACVFLIGLDEFDRGELADAEIRRLVYAGITRARHRLFIPFLKRTAMIEDLLAAL
jgi:superfamily I DNA/RNA helicase